MLVGSFQHEMDALGQWVLGFDGFSHGNRAMKAMGACNEYDVEISAFYLLDVGSEEFLELGFTHDGVSDAVVQRRLR